ncbi:hypothetical protein EV356DRAFT_502008 [Viridothelium virens]|uniref:Secreted protein n=1 Tax=Viridothelium virens TaxID=1048519 RepID=A0A6A6HNM5_VIRVR|nr:hypothetical protein EV356DRAFT_502008 [Viridothelium virens]
MMMSSRQGAFSIAFILLSSILEDATVGAGDSRIKNEQRIWNMVASSCSNWLLPESSTRFHRWQNVSRIIRSMHYVTNAGRSIDVQLSTSFPEKKLDCSEVLLVNTRIGAKSIPDPEV